MKAYAKASLAVVVLLSSFTITAATIWREGENAFSADVTPHGWYNDVKKDVLSNGEWLGHYDANKTGMVMFTFDAPAAGTYAFWVRANPTGQLSWQLDEGEWHQVPFDSAVERQNIAADDHLDIRFIAWVSLGDVTLSEGSHSLRFKMDSANNNHGAIDCFVLTTDSFYPKGTEKPKQGEAPVKVFDFNTSWAFTPPKDTYRTNALLDLRQLNEKEAGETGFIGLSQDGMDFVKGDGTPIRFWSMLSGPGNWSHEQIDEHTRFLAKLGVNMARIFSSLCDTSEGAKVTDFNDKGIDAIQYYVASAKKNGIYCTINPFWAHTTVPGSWGIEGYSNESAWGVLFFNEDYQAGYKAWMRELYTRPSPYTGIPLKDEPAVAIIQIKNEDSLLFYTFGAIKEPQLKILRKKFGDWLKQKYGSLEQASAAWQGESQENDDLAAGELGFYPTWEFTSACDIPFRPGRRARMADQLHFLGWTQRKFYGDMESFYRNELGCKQLINAMNWKAADPVLMDDVERWSYATNEVIAVNRYTGVMHVGENNGYRIDPGHLFISEPVVKNPETLPCALKQVQGAPFIITESAWVRPTRYKAVGPMMIAAYMSLTGVDSLYWFAASEPQWELDSRRTFWPVGDAYAVTKWSGSLPEQMGMFPANALAFRRDYIARAKEPVVYEERSLDSMWRRDVPIISEAGKFDPNRDAGAFAADSGVKQEVDRLAFLVGPVVVKFGGDEQNSRVLPGLDSYIDRDKGVVKSVTSQIALDYKDGVLKVNAPKYQGVGGFLRDGGGTYELNDVTITSGNEYAAISVTALDDKPLKISEKILVQVGTIARPTGWATQQVETNIQGRTLVMQKIIDTGDPPLRIDNTRAWLEVRNPYLNKAVLLDVSGYEAAEVPCELTGQALQLKLPLTTMYLVLEGEGAPDTLPREETATAPAAAPAAGGEAAPTAGPAPSAQKKGGIPLTGIVVLGVGAVVLVIAIVNRARS